MRKGGGFLYKRLIAERKERGLVQKDVAKMLDLGFYTYRRREIGEIDFKLSECKKLSEMFEVPIEDLFKQF